MRGPSTVGAVCVLCVTVSIVVAHLFSLQDRGGALWGADLWAFLPPWSSEVALAGVVLAAWPVCRWVIAEVRSPRAEP
ncbi:MAG TPA: hypothetical protein VL123_02730 [Candidatus Udaeobacter sp.]|jgi:hypothetical protein|nr:hypothetical protein [Candidatus Udaeobacter sp.]